MQKDATKEATVLIFDEFMSVMLVSVRLKSIKAYPDLSPPADTRPGTHSFNLALPGVLGEEIGWQVLLVPELSKFRELQI